MTPEVQRALDLAKKKYGPRLQGATPPRAAVPAFARKKHCVHPQRAFAVGQNDKRAGFDRVSPYYDAPGSDHFWFAGYDGKTMEEAIATQ